MRSISWTHAPLLLIFGAALAAGCSSDSPAAAPGTPDASTCGNKTVDKGEDCDGTSLGTATCSSASMGMMTTGKLACLKTCKFDLSGCTKAGTGGTSGGGAGNGGSPPSNGGSPAGGKSGKDGGTTDSGSGGTGGTDASTPDATTPIMDASKKG